MNSSRKYVVVKFAHIVIFVFLQGIIMCLLQWNNSSFYWAQIVSVLAIFLLFFQLIGFYIIKVSILEFRFWFVFLNYLFMFGIVFLLGFGYEDAVFWKLHREFSTDLLLKAGFCVLVYIQVLYLGIIFCDGNKKSKIYNSVIIKNTTTMRYSIFYTGIIILICTLPFRLINDISLILSAKRTKNYFKIATNSGLTDDLAFLFVPAVIYIISSKRLKKSINFLFAGIICFYFCLIMILTGDRRYCVTGIIAIILCLMKTYNFKIYFFNLVLCGGIGTILLNVLTIIRNIRKGHLLSFYNFFAQNIGNIFSITTLGSTIKETFAEFGISFFSVVQVMKNIPNTINYQAGFSFFGAIPTILPIGWLSPEFFEKVSIAGYINTIEKNPVGETIIGELYANFGIFYIIIAFVFGYFITRFFSYNRINNENLSIARHYSFFYIEINLIRACFIEVFRNSVMLYIVPLLILYCIKKRYKRSEEKYD